MAATKRRRRKKVGRPKGSGVKKPSELRSHRVLVSLTRTEVSKLRGLARQRKAPVGTVARDLLLAALARAH